MAIVRTAKFILEKPSVIWFLIMAVYAGMFWAGNRADAPNPAEQSALSVIEQFSQSTFPPKIGLLRELPDWGHAGYYAVYGRFHLFLKGNLENLRLVGLLTMALAFVLFVRLGYRLTRRNRINPLWISLALVVLAANPYAAGAAFRVGPSALLLMLSLAAMLCFEGENVGWSALFMSAAVLVDFRALLLALAFTITRVTGEQSRLLRPERMIAFLLPFVVAALPVIVWGGPVPQGEAREWLDLFREKAPLMRPDTLFYALALLPLYAFGFSWSWGIRARSRALTVGAIVAALCIPLYFLFPPHWDWWDEIKNSAETPLGLVDQGAIAVAGPYKNLLLFVPWLGGAFLFAQLLMMDVLDRSRWLRYFIIFFFCVQPFVIGVGDSEFLMVLPPILLLSLAEALVGEEGKLS